MHKKSMEIVKKSPGTPESTHSEETKGKDSDMSWPNRSRGIDDSDDMAIDLSSTSKQDSSKSTLKSASPQRDSIRNSDLDDES